MRASGCYSALFSSAGSFPLFFLSSSLILLPMGDFRVFGVDSKIEPNRKVTSGAVSLIVDDPTRTFAAHRGEGP